MMDKIEKPLVSIVVVGWNTKRFLKDFWDSLFKINYKNIECFYIDNGSSDGSAEFVVQNYPQVEVIAKNTNLGFAESNNIGMRLAKGKYVLLINNDTIQEKDFLEKLVKVMDEDRFVGAVTPKLLMMHDHSIINGAGGDMVSRSGDNNSRGFYMKDEGQFDKQEDIFGPSGAAALLRKEMLDAIGLFDKSLHTYYEDVDLNVRMQMTGWRCVYVPSSVIYHYQSGTHDDFNPRKIFLLNRNKYYVIFKNYPITTIWFYKRPLWEAFKGLMKYCNENGYSIVWKKILLSLLLKFPIILIKRVSMFILTHRAISGKIIRWVEHHETVKRDTHVDQNVAKYLEDLKKR